MKLIERGIWMTACFLALATPALANNPPTPDGNLGLLLVFPAAVIALRLSGAKRPAKLLAVGLGLTVMAVVAGAGVLALVSPLVLLAYGAVQSVRVIRSGRGRRRYAIGVGLLLFVLCLVINFVSAVSLGARAGALYPESMASDKLEYLNKMEEIFRSEKRIDANGNGVGEYGTIEQLVQAYPDGSTRALLAPGGFYGYRFSVVLSGDPARDEKQYFACASPLHYGARRWLAFLELRRTGGEARYYGRNTFVSDETGAIRKRDLQGSRAVTREEAAAW